jgi:hypothetical protein
MLAFPYICRPNKDFVEIIEFEMFGLNLQEPMALVTDWLIASFSFYAFFKLKKNETQFQDYWKMFYLMLGISMLFGGLGHLFYQYWGIPGKFPCWSLGISAGIYSSFAMISVWPNKKQQVNFRRFVLIKSVLLLTLAFATQKFLFVAIDTTLAYLFFCGYLAYKLFKKNYVGMKYISLGVLVLLPSAFIFGLQINIHRFLNKDDLSHLFMVACIVMFYIGVKRTDKAQIMSVAD